MKQPHAVRLDTELVAAVREHGAPLTGAIEEGLRLWLSRQKDQPPGPALWREEWAKEPAEAA